MKEAALVLFVNSKGHMLLHLKDNKPGELFSGQWGLMEGSLQEDGSNSGALVRGIMEDHSLTHRAFKFLNTYEHREQKNNSHYNFYVFFCVIDLKLLNVTLHEGRKIAYFTAKEVDTLDTPAVVKTIIRDTVKALTHK